ncbi:MAG: transporter substrate-binding protein [Opitutae bacterium]|jgi:urea transport system substrate-binding protein|nr:transporter substrate-binding protein [Opitutales bacterium]MDB2310952.1 transporter substrate-binding protein [Opitutales bacterium]MDB2681564.1 transporter substrate-binding protein [Opitutales bacterium]MDG1667311.1 transporter substrate-binding protein [Opitutae bacterium]MDG2345292.1 transporter substrate-binding protein [Opitutae bacterium]
MIKSLNKFSKLIACGALATASFGIAQAEDETVKVGVLHSLSGTMAISETSLRDILLFTFDEINASGGVLGKQIEPVVADGASDWPVFAEKAEQLLAQDGVSAIFGCWTSVSRKFALPVVEKYKGLLFYPVQYEGEEESPNIIYTAEAVGQQAIPAVDYLLAEGYKKFYLIGTDYVYPQTTNIVLFEYLLSKGIPVENIGGGIRYEGDVAVSAGNYTPFGHTDFQQIVADIKDFAASGEACVINTINGDANVPFFKEIAASGLTSDDCPIVSFSLSEDEFRGLPTKDLVGHLGCWTYFMSIESEANDAFKENFQTWLKTEAPDAVQKEGRVTCSPMVLSYNGVYLWKAAVEKAGTFDPEAVIKALESGISFEGPGGKVTSQENHHVTKSVYIGETLEDGQFEILEVIPDVYGEPWLKGTFE